MKKALALLLTLVMVLSLAACGGVEKTPETTKAPSTEAMVSTILFDNVSEVIHAPPV